MAKASKGQGSFGKMTKAGFAPAEFAEPTTPDYVVVQLRYEAPVAVAAARFAAPGAAKPQADSLNQVLSNFDVKTVRPHFDVKPKAMAARVAVAATLPAAPHPEDFAKRGMTSEFIQSGFVQVVPKDPKDARKIAQALTRNKAVWNAFVAPRPAPPGAAAPTNATGSAAGCGNFEPSQGYLCDAPNGIGAIGGAWSQKGGRGKGITVCDIEGAWNLKHEDLPRGIKLIGGQMENDLGWRNHGTAVLGEMVAVKNKFGAIGICHESRAVVQSAFINNVFNLPAALMNAASLLKKGDVILIELHAIGPNGKYVAMQYWDDTFSAIRAVTDMGITVVEAAGNGDEDFDAPGFAGTGLQKDCGAIVVGAGVPPTNYMDNEGFGAAFPPYSFIGVPRSRIFFSNYGKIVNVQAWGWHVTTLAYGDAQGGASENKWYTLRFSGTSSASPIVTGAAACLQARAKAKGTGPLTPDKVRQILMKTGTPQQPGPGVPLTQNIGPQPNLAEAIKLV
jgi:hypothetical protein